MKKIRRAIISLSNKEDLRSVLKTLNKYKIEIISSGGTYKKIKVRKETAFMDQMRNTTTHKLKSTCCFNKRDEKDII